MSLERDIELFDSLWKAVKDDSSNFEAWTNLLQTIDNLDDIRKARDVYDSFFARFPYCYGYWRKYAEIERRHKNFDRCLEVYERGIQAIPLSIDLWLSYIAFYKDFMQDSDYREKKIRQLFEKAIDAAGLEFRSDRIWEAWLGWEREQRHHSAKKVLNVYDQLIRTPTLMYSMHFERLQDFVNQHSPDEMLSEQEYYDHSREIEKKLKEKGVEIYSVEENLNEMDRRSSSPTSLPKSQSRSPTNSRNHFDGDEINEHSKSSKLGQTEFRKKFTDEALKEFRIRILDRRRRIHLTTEAEVSKRWNFEDAIKRPYFHVKPLERAQLKNWRNYLDFEIAEGDPKRISVLFERALIACALYEDLWVKYARYMESQESRLAREVYQRACLIHLPKKPNPRLAWAALEERKGNFEEARKILGEFARQNPGLVTIELRRIGLERRFILQESEESLPDYTKVCQMYEELIRNENEAPRVSSFYAIKYARFMDKAKCDRKMAEKILLDASDRNPENTQIYLQLLELALHNSPMSESDVLRALDRALLAPISHQDKLAFSQRKLEFLEDVGCDIKLLQEHYEWHQKYSKSLQTRKRSTVDAKDEPTSDASDAKTPKLAEKATSMPVPPSPTVSNVTSQPVFSAPPVMHQAAAHQRPPFIPPMVGAAGGAIPRLPQQPPTAAAAIAPSGYYDYFSQNFPHQWNQYGAYYYPPPY